MNNKKTKLLKVGAYVLAASVSIPSMTTAVALTSPIPVMAEEKTEQCTVTLDANGGTLLTWDDGVEAETDQFEVDKGTSLGDCGRWYAPEKEGYVFEGWAYEKTANTDDDYYSLDEITVDESITLYAVWTRVYNITLDANGGYFEVEDYDDEGNETVVQQGSLSGQLREKYHLGSADWFVCAPVSENGGIIGWSETKNPTEDELIPADEIDDQEFNKDTVLYAIWGEKCKITLHANSPSAYFSYYDEEADDDKQSDTVEAECTLNPITGAYDVMYTQGTSVPTMTDNSKYFGWWSTSPDSSDAGVIDDAGKEMAPELEMINITGDTDLYAAWKTKTPISSDKIKVKLNKTQFTYNGRVQEPWVQYLTVANENYDESGIFMSGIKVSNPSSKDAGTYQLTITLDGMWTKYTGSKTVTYKIAQAGQPMTVKPVKRTIKAKSLKKRSKTIARPLAVNNNQGKLSYSKIAKGSSKKIKINKKTGKITIKKRTKPGKYKIKIKVNAAGNKNYQAGSKTVTAVVTVKK